MFATSPMRIKIPTLLLMASASILTSSCAPTYDNIADQMLVDTQKQADEGLLKLQSVSRKTVIHNTPNGQDIRCDKAATYSSNRDFYDKLQSSVSALNTRITALKGLSTPTIASTLSGLQIGIHNLRVTHEAQKCLTADAVDNSKDLIDQQFKALTVYELTIKNGSRPK
jgi:hypothetical protein